VLIMMPKGNRLIARGIRKVVEALVASPQQKEEQEQSEPLAHVNENTILHLRVDRVSQSQASEHG
jgi:hypothetical protein